MGFFDEYKEMGSRDPSDMMKWILFGLVIVLIISGFAYADYTGITLRWIIPGNVTVETLSATDVGTNYATLNGNLTKLEGGSAVVWFEYGREKGKYTYRTENTTLTSTGNFSQKIEGIQLMPGTTYHFRACASGSGTVYGDDLSFQTQDLSGFETKNFGKHYTELEESGLNVTNLADVLPKTYTDLMVDSRIFYGLFFGLIFLAMWIRQEDVTVPALLGMIIGGAIWALLPGEMLKVAQALFIVAFAGLVYSLIKGRRG
ncbi:MAG TPA: hypothetical protein ENG09_00620 [Candidatus Syntrophoarchaeum butanivorans]|uniref:Uncharacterized protein n=1 Tax=Candidatus Syntropharchaeum butanivorans TaxID=1839936 RepID=A0A7C1B5P9_9EURY|nr:hypothetical protein [Candidatus Syntrophoarchaeum butanivorans]